MLNGIRLLIISVWQVVGFTNGASQSSVDSCVKNAEVDIVEIQFGQQMNWHSVRNYPKIV